ncbi:hypothetical protein CLIB1444_03S02168 [[Candida] jaroonii]|uniref:Uncharacterized protein n=1 Tax=[Candida] jaroonii TaxID=467808 RepID=A0ACA9Y4Z9_9ASCO|nr:hypothetical protein CLIB1444_03S02168 [[Candida] jaroonii]
MKTHIDSLQDIIASHEGVMIVRDRPRHHELMGNHMIQSSDQTNQFSSPGVVSKDNKDTSSHSKSRIPEEVNINNGIKLHPFFESKIKPGWLNKLPMTLPLIENAEMVNTSIGPIKDQKMDSPFPHDLIRSKLKTAQQKPPKVSQGKISKNYNKKPVLSAKAKFIQKHTQRIRKNRVECDDCDRVSIEGTCYAVTRSGSVLVPLTLWRMTSTKPVEWNDKMYSRAENGNLYSEIKHEIEFCKTYCRTGFCFKGEVCTKVHDPKRVRICSHFMGKGCTSDNCLYSHSPNNWNTPTCRFGTECSNHNCKYLHSYPEHSDNREFEIWGCRPFAINGYCQRGTKCPFYHYLTCPDFYEYNSCKKRCGLFHLASKVTLEKSLGQTPSLALINSYTVLPHKLFPPPDTDTNPENQYILDFESSDDDEIDELDNDLILIV